MPRPFREAREAYIMNVMMLQFRSSWQAVEVLSAMKAAHH
jgi:hypothetical protein